MQAVAKGEGKLNISCAREGSFFILNSVAGFIHCRLDLPANLRAVSVNAENVNWGGQRAFAKWGSLGSSSFVGERLLSLLTLSWREVL